MRRLIWSLASLRDLRAIDEYIASESRQAALRTLQAIRDRADQLRTYPRSGPVLSGEFRSLSVRTAPYLIIYRAAKDRIEIVRIRHTREDWRPQ